MPDFANQSNFLLHGPRRWRVAQLVNKIPTFYETQRFIIVFNGLYHESDESSPHPHALLL
jgi:hypothetical protein